MSCPKCGSNSFVTERRLDGNSRCLSCHHTNKTSEFRTKQKDQKMITIKKSATADTRTCDFRNVSVETLLKSSRQHIADVSEGMKFFVQMIAIAAGNHDHTKLSRIEMFHKDFVGGFETQDWYTMHKQVERHHIGTSTPDGIKDDVNLIDVLEHVVDCVMAGMGRSGSVYPMSVSNEVLQKALQNTADLLQRNIEVEE